MADITREEFGKIYEKILEEESMPASEEVREAYKTFNRALNDYISAVSENSFYYGYMFGINKD